tara:strand:- start:1349 stop:2098 length:750 start_codon:yes stop_codon:yes gene_type:complete
MIRFKDNYFALIILILASCGGGNDSESEIITPSTTVESATLKVDPPTNAILSFPENDKVCEQGTSISNNLSSLNFQWLAGQNTDSYELQILNLNNQQIVIQNNITTTSKSVSLDKSTPYSWKVISKRVGAESAESDTWKFYLSGDGITNYAPFPANIISPIMGTVFPSSTTLITLNWNGTDPDQDTLSYTLYIDSIDGFQSPIIKHIGLVENSLSVEVIPGGIYFWRIKSTDSNDNSSYSLVYSFQVEN